MSNRILSRRSILKLAGALAIPAAAAAFLPEEWLAPVVRSGLHPVHAQASGSTGISGKVTIPGGGSPQSAPGVLVGANDNLASFKAPKLAKILPGPGPSYHYSAVTAADGTYFIACPAGEYLVSCYAAGGLAAYDIYARVNGIYTKVPVVDGSITTGVDFYMS